MAVTQAHVPQIRHAAETARYAGSPYHRLANSKMGRPAGRRWPAASKCEPDWTQENATNALRSAIRAGMVSSDWKNGYPVLAWHRKGDVLYEARLSNSGLGEYHAYPLESPLEWPDKTR